MERMMIIQAYCGEIGLAVMEDNKLTEYHTQGFYQEKIVGNIYLGRVANVLPGMQAAFVDLGIGKNALLHNRDIEPTGQGNTPRRTGRRPGIADSVKVGQELLVQVVKEGTRTKGPRITTRVSLPGRFTVLMPGQNCLFLSRRIVGEEKRKLVRGLAQGLKNSGYGVILRTAAQEASLKDLKKDFNYLRALWERINKKANKGGAPALLHRDLALVPALLRDYLGTDIKRILVNSPQIKKEVQGLVKLYAPALNNKVVLQEGDLFELFKINSQMEQSLERRVWLKSGAYLVIDGTEALTAIDVNTGKFTGSANLAQTVLQVNLEAATEIGRQLRLRNISGMIVVDFIDMTSETDWQQVLGALEAATKKDPNKTQILGLTRLGLVEINRKKTRKSLSGIWLSNCPYCQGKGKVLGMEGMISRLRQQLFSMAAKATGPGILIGLNAGVAAFLINHHLEELISLTGKDLIVMGRKTWHRETLVLEALVAGADVMPKMLPLEAGQILPWSGVMAAAPSPGRHEFAVAGYQLKVTLAKGKTPARKPGPYLEITDVSAAAVTAQMLAGPADGRARP